jgi:hypothetical protein
MKHICAVVLLLAATAAAQAQSKIPTFAEVQRAAAEKENATARITLGVNMFVSAPSGDQAMQAYEKARRQMYEMAKKECAVLRDVIAKDCSIEAVNVSINRNQGLQQSEGFTVNANMTFRISTQ